MFCLFTTLRSKVYSTIQSNIALLDTNLHDWTSAFFFFFKLEWNRWSYFKNKRRKEKALNGEKHSVPMSIVQQAYNRQSLYYMVLVVTNAVPPSSVAGSGILCSCTVLHKGSPLPPSVQACFAVSMLVLMSCHCKLVWAPGCRWGHGEGASAALCNMSAWLIPFEGRERIKGGGSAFWRGSCCCSSASPPTVTTVVLMFKCN